MVSKAFLIPLYIRQKRTTQDNHLLLPHYVAFSSISYIIEQQLNTRWKRGLLLTVKLALAYSLWQQA